MGMEWMEWDDGDPIRFWENHRKMVLLWENHRKTIGKYAGND